MEQRQIRLGERLGVADIDAIARHGAAVTLAAAARERVERAYAFVRELARGATPVYGLTTGCGPLSGNAISPEQREAFQRNLIRSHACTLGAPHPAELVRAAMAVRAQVFALGGSGIDPALVDLLTGMLDRGVHPIVREVGGVGASGDLVELAQVALALLGEGEVEWRGSMRPARDALREAGLEPLVPRYREGLALINGTSFHTGAAALLIERARRIARAAEIAAALAFEALGGHVEAFAGGLHAARPHPGQRAVAARLTGLLAGSRLVRRDEPAAPRQDAYTLRCIPQVLGTVVEAVDAAAEVTEIEINSITDNPLFLVEERRVLHGGNFHGQPVATSLDHLKVAMVELGVICERRLARLLDPALNGGLPPFLVRQPAGLHNGFMGLQYCASAMAADNAVLAAPASVRSVPTNANNQDVVSMGMVAARQAARVVDNAASMVAIELLCAAQALELRGVDKAADATRDAHAVIRRHSATLDDDRPLTEDVDAVRRLIDESAF